MCGIGAAFFLFDPGSSPVVCIARLFLTHAHMIMPTIPASPATADPVAMPIVRALVLGDELPLSVMDVAVGEGLDATGTDVEDPGVLSVTKPLPVADGVTAVSVDEVEVAVASPSVLSVSITQSDAPLHEYPKGQHCEPHVASCPVRSVE